MIDLKTNIAGIEFNTPIIAASGTFGFGVEYARYFEPGSIGGIALKGMTIKPKLGNDTIRIAETPSGVLNSIGLQNPGVDYYLKEYDKRLPRFKTKLIANISGSTYEEYCQVAEKLQDSNIDMIELNISCPNVKEGGISFGGTPQSVYDITKTVKPYCKQPLIVKLTPNVLDITENALAAENAGADAVSMINTLIGMVIDVDKKKPLLSNKIGGLSGPAIMPVALRMVWQTAKKLSIPIIGMGGIMTGEDAAAFLLAGASAVSVGTATLANPNAINNITNELVAYMEKQGYNSINEMVNDLDE